MHCSTCTITHPLSPFHGAAAEQTQGHCDGESGARPASWRSLLVVVCVFASVCSPAALFGSLFVPDGSTRPICDPNADVQGQRAARSEPTRRPRFPANWAAPAAECQGVKMPKAQAGAPSGRRPPVETAQLLHLH